MDDTKRLLAGVSAVCILASPMSASAQPGPSDGRPPAARPAEPEFLIHAQKNLERSRVALQAEQKALDQLRQEEAALRRVAVARKGSWIEPSYLWKKKETLKQSISRKQQAVDVASRRLSRAETEAHTASESNWSARHRPSWLRSWWPW